ncbi:MAG: AAA family ATPase [Chloroflexi bacterium]|nr:AAA family ATPase [Chloroflexota bacterium]MBL01790.1 AAA family ATPase [Chloroflexota bacterium]|tara:strand:+ start:277 stop:1143 length:867 start_codon:yes stop_codon:yes gene_type:complete
MTKEQNFVQQDIENFHIAEEPFYVSTSDEVEIFESAYKQRVPVLLKGPTGTGKTRFVEYMAWKLSNSSIKKNISKAEKLPLITVACHEDLNASDLVGRYLLDANGTRWIDGPLTRAVKVGAICYLDEVVEARKDTTVIIHPLTDHRRSLTIDKLGTVIDAAPGFLLVVSYNPGYQNALKDLKHSTRQRFVALEFDFPDEEREAKIIMHESGCESDVAERLAKLGSKIRNLREHGLEEGASTRMLIYAGKLINDGVPERRACQVSVTWGITDDFQIQRSIDEVVTSIFA